MANEFTIINNPDNTPGAVSSGYQRQNTRASVASNGCDYSSLEVTDTDEVTLNVSGGVDVSGTLYACASPVVFTSITAGRYYIALVGTGDTLTPTIGTDAGTFDASKNARYTALGYRVLDWLVVMDDYGGSQEILSIFKTKNLIDPIAQNAPVLLLSHVISSTGSTTWTAPRSQVYTFELQACGGDGGETDDPSTNYYWGGGGGGGGYVKLSEFVEEGTVLTLTKSIVSSANNTLTGSGFTTITAENGEDGTDNDSVQLTGYAGAGGTASGGDLNIPGQAGTAGLRSTSSVPWKYSITMGGSSFLGFGGLYSLISAVLYSDGYDYGGGGRGAISSSGSAGAGGDGILLIWGSIKNGMLE